MAPRPDPGRIVDVSSRRHDEEISHPSRNGRASCTCSTWTDGSVQCRRHPRASSSLDHRPLAGRGPLSSIPASSTRARVDPRARRRHVLRRCARLRSVSAPRRRAHAFRYRWRSSRRTGRTIGSALGEKEPTGSFLPPTPRWHAIRTFLRRGSFASPSASSFSTLPRCRVSGRCFCRGSGRLLFVCLLRRICARRGGFRPDLRARTSCLDPSFRSAAARTP